MRTAQRATVYFQADIHKALRLRAASNDRSKRGLGKEAVRVSLAEDVADLAVFDRRRKEPRVSLESFVQSMKRPGLI